MPKQAQLIFNVNDYQHSDTAIAKGVDNSVPDELVDNLLLLHHEIIVPVKKHFEDVTITSGYRSPLLNTATGSQNKNSQHTKGQAVDLVTSDLKSLFNFILADLPFDQLIYESYGGKRWVHVSFNKDNRRAMAMKTDDGKKFSVQPAFA